VGRKILAVWIFLGKFHAFASKAFVRFDPARFRLGSNNHLAQMVSILQGRIESDDQAQHEKGVLHFDKRSFQQEGRQTGYFESMGLTWPTISGNHTGILDTLVSIYGSATQARAAFGAQAGAYDLLVSGCDTCNFTVQRENTHAFVGDCCQAIYDSVFNDGYLISEVFFVRGQVLVQDWLGFQAPVSHSFIAGAAKAHVFSAAILDRVAWFQQQP